VKHLNIECVSCDERDEAEERFDHQAYNIAQPDGSTPMQEIKAWPNLTADE
jgi:hypothetical protein